MPSKDEMNDVYEDQLRKIERRIMNDMQPKGPPDIWKPESYEYKQERESARQKFKNDIFQDWTKPLGRDPDEIFRKQTTKDITEIKDAIRKIGIMFDEDKPSNEMMDDHKMLKDAYKKYKMIEALILGKQK